MTVREIILKGGSLSRTAIIEKDGRRVVRKSISRIENREYGYYRWYSQLKRIQRYNHLFAGLFPALLDVGLQANGTEAYFDIAYISGAIDVKQYLVDHAPSPVAVESLHHKLWAAMRRLHEVELCTPRHSPSLYFAEEVDQKLREACGNPEFKAYADQPDLLYLDAPCRSLIYDLKRLRASFAQCVISSECFTHGNLTLENVLYTPESGMITFIDPYDENVLDCVENEYSQVLQCCNRLYGFINDRDVSVIGNAASFAWSPPPAMEQFDSLFREQLKLCCDVERLRTIQLFEISQFVRMLPFKIAAGHIEKAKFFYTLASKLLSDLK